MVVLAGFLVTGTGTEGPIWRERAPLPVPRAGYMAGVVRRYLIIAGGSYWQGNQKQRTSRVDIYDPSTNAWTLERQRLLIRD